MTYSQFLKSLIGQKGEMEDVGSSIFIDITSEIKQRVILIIDVGDDYVIIEDIFETNGMKKRTIIPLNLLVVRMN